ncbi:MAG: DUF3223 domain-containing protein [Bacteroidales bacterium]|nr:DUF3223 domain-containing protein [Bacteroidales bacterium]MBN2748342.1 DUF3223 domain-containing protein [Bacteroidales bacterium]
MLKIGEREFKFKKDALNYYKEILNSYDFGEMLKDDHYNDIIDLLNYDISFSDNHPEVEERENEEEAGNDDYVIENIRIGKVQFNTKCFELVYRNGETDFISYRLRISKRKEDNFNDFRIAARNAVQCDLRSVKQEYFDNFSKKGFVPCQETGIQSNWSDLVVDHRQPNTFSIIVDRFIEMNKINLEEIEYVTDFNNLYIFKDNDLLETFRKYHKEKAVLRVVRKECNSSRAYQGRLKEQKRDLRIKN